MTKSTNDKPEEIVFINFKISKNKRKQLKHVLIDDDTTITKFLMEHIDNRLKSVK